MTLTQDRLKELLFYDAASGVFTWEKPASNRVKKGSIAGTLDREGYLQIRVDSVAYRAHHLAWIYVYGRKPSEIDHINRVKSDNSINNLREVSSSDNSKNVGMYAHNTSGVTGVSWNKDYGKWVAYINSEGKHIHLGLHSHIFEAACARKRAENLYNFARLEVV